MSENFGTRYCVWRGGAARVVLSGNAREVGWGGAGRGGAGRNAVPCTQHVAGRRAGGPPAAHAVVAAPHPLCAAHGRCKRPRAGSAGCRAGKQRSPPRPRAHTTCLLTRSATTDGAGALVRGRGRIFAERQRQVVAPRVVVLLLVVRLRAAQVREDVASSASCACASGRTGSHPWRAAYCVPCRSTMLFCRC